MHQKNQEISKSDLSGKTYLMTGGNSGIGYEAIRNFASRGASVILVCRSASKGREALEEIKRETGNNSLFLYIADFGSLNSVNRFAKRVLNDFSKIDVLCNNAGGANATRVVTKEGFEMTFVTNHLSGFLLTKMLLPILSVSNDEEPARVIFTSSYGHAHSALNFDDLELVEGYRSLRAYGRSKLMNLLTAREFSLRFQRENIIFSSFHPGAVRTPIWRKGGLAARFIGFVLFPFLISVKKGSDTFIWLASSRDREVLEANGQYFYKRKRARVAVHATAAAASKLWDLTEEIIAPFAE